MATTLESRDFTAPRHHSWETIHTEWHKLYNADLFVRVDAHYADQERQMRECMGYRENYDLEAVRRVVAHWETVCAGSNAHRVALLVLEERLAELAPALEQLGQALLACEQAGVTIDAHLDFETPEGCPLRIRQGDTVLWDGADHGGQHYLNFAAAELAAMALRAGK